MMEAQKRAERNWRRRVVKDYMRGVIEKASEKLILPPHVAEDAFEIVESLQGKSLRVSAFATLYYVIHQSEDCPPISLNDYVDILNIRGRKKLIWQTYKQIYWKFKDKPKVCAIRPTIYVRRYLAELDANEKVKQVALELNKKVITQKLHLGKKPSSIAVGIVYIAFILDGERQVTQRELSDVSGINEVTIRSSYRTIIEGLGIKRSFKIPWVFRK